MGLEKLFRLLRQWTINSEKELSQLFNHLPRLTYKKLENELTKWAPHLIFNRFSSKTSDTDLIKLIANSYILITNYENLELG